MRISLVIESWNLGRDPAPVAAGLTALLARLRPQLGGVEVVVTHEGLDEPTRAQVGDVTWVEVPRGSDYYTHKNLGFAATRGDIVAFTDGDCAPSADWLTRLTGPIARGQARVVAGRTSYPGGRALETSLDFPLFTAGLPAGSVRNFFANNVAFAREAFSGYPEIPGMFHGQCQVLALTLQARGLVIHLAPDATLEHAFAAERREWLRVHLLRGADASSLAPHVVGAHAPSLSRVTRALAPLPALVGIGLRAVGATLGVVRSREALASSVATIATVSVVEAVGAVAERTVHRRLP